MSHESENELREIISIDEDDSYQISKKKQWSRKQTKLLVSKRVEANGDFLRKKQKTEVLWRKILINMKAEDPELTFSKEEIIRKFHNLLQTYKKAKTRMQKSGSDTIKWEYYEDFDQIFGCKHSVDPPRNLLASIMENENENEIVDEVDEAEEIEPVPKKRRTQKSDDILNFLKEWKEEDRKAEMEEKKKEHENFEKHMEVEKQKIQAIKDLTNILKNMM